MMDPDYEEIHKHTFENLDKVRASTNAVCLSCKRVIDIASMFRDYSLDDICVSWIDENTMEETVFCPHCGIDAIIGDATGFPVTDPEFIKRLHAVAFQTNPEVVE